MSIHANPSDIVIHKLWSFQMFNIQVTWFCGHCSMDML